MTSREMPQNCNNNCGESHKPSSKQEEVFLTMYLRKMQRNLNGTRERENYRHLVALFCLLVLIYGAGASNVVPNHSIIITLELWQLVSIGGWILVSLTITTIFRTSPFIIVLYWMIVYWPLLAILTTLLLNGVISPFSLIIVASLFVVAEVLTLVLFVIRHYLYPWIIGTPWFLNEIGAGRFWSIRTFQSASCEEDSTMSWNINYSGFFGSQKRHNCRYRGQLNERGLPHGLGQWVDDAFNGEVLEGTWHHGKPIAPYVSRQYGTGDTFAAVSIAYIMTTDDDFAKNKLFPTNDSLPLRYGVASVECSIYGHFYNNLPQASNVYGPHNVGEDHTVDTFLADCFRWLVHLDKDDNEYEYQTFSQNRMNRVTRHFRSCHRSNRTPVSWGSSTESTPFGPSPNLQDDRNVLLQVSNNDPTSAKDDKGHFATHDNRTCINDDIMNMDKELRSCSPKEALIYLPGFNSHLKKSLESLGQFLAMSWLSSNVYPICFSWPCGQFMSYWHVTTLSASDKNMERFLQLLEGLLSAGIRKVHFMTHSLGVLTLLAAFEDKMDGTRSDASRCFAADPSLALDEERGGDTAANENENIDNWMNKKNGKTLLMCQNIIMLNPDFPVNAFVDHSYLTIRRICSHITMVGDKHDHALFASQCLNSAARYGGCGSAQPLSVLNVKVAHVTTTSTTTSDGCPNNPPPFGNQRVIGRDLDYLYFPPTTATTTTTTINETATTNTQNNHNSFSSGRLYFQQPPPTSILGHESSKSNSDCGGGGGEDDQRKWLDMDVIDTTLLDTNIQEWRHSAFNMNPILLNDLKELILTGHRAVGRSTLLHRKGNIFSYCHAPSFVSM